MRTSATRKIASEITYLTFLQTEKVTEKRRPIRLKVYIEDEAGERVSNENIIIANSTSSYPAERTYKEKFVLREMNDDRRKTYYLVLAYDAERKEKVYERYPFTIDIP